MNRAHFLIAILTAISLVRVQFAVAQPSLTQSVFEDCNAARSMLEEAKREELSERYLMLVKVLDLNTQVPEVPEAFSALPGDKMQPQFGPAALWPSVDARRELEGKRCAVTLLAEAGYRAATALPALVDLYSSQGLSDEIGVRIEEVSVDITEGATRRGFRGSESAIDSIIVSVSAQNPMVAENVLIEFYPRAAPLVLKAWANADEPIAERFARIVREGDPTGIKSLTALINDRDRFTEAERFEIVHKLPQPKEIPGPRVIRALFSLIAERSYAELIGKVCERLDWKRALAVEPSLKEQLLQNQSLLEPGYIGFDGQHCLASKAPELGLRVVEMLESPDPGVFRHAARLLPAVQEELPNKAVTRAYDFSSRRLSEDDGTAAAALGASVLLSSNRWHTVRVVAEALRYAVSKHYSSPNDDLIAVIMQSILDLGRRADTHRFDDFMVESLKAGRRVDETLLWFGRAGGKKINDRIIETLAWTRRDAAGTIVRWFLSSSKPSKSVIRKLLEARERSDVAAIIDRELVRRAYVIGADLLRIIEEQNKERDLLHFALSASAPNGSTQSQGATVASLVTAIAKASCREIETHGRVAAEFMARNNLTANDARELSSHVVPCLLSGSSGGAADLAATSAVLSSDELAQFLPSPELSEKQARAIVEGLEYAHSNGIRKNAATISRLVLLLLENPSVEVRGAVLSSPIVELATDPAVSSLILTQFQQLPELERGSSSHLVALARLQIPEVNWGDVIRRAAARFSAGGLPRSTEKALRLLPTTIAVPEIRLLLDKNVRDERLGAMRIAGLLGEKSRELLPRLVELTKDVDPGLRYAAVVAMIEIDPASSGLSESLRRLLVNRYFGSALEARVQWERTEAAAGLDRPAFGILRTGRIETLTSRNG